MMTMMSPYSNTVWQDFFVDDDDCEGDDDATLDLVMPTRYGKILVVDHDDGADEDDAAALETVTL